MKKVPISKSKLKAMIIVFVFLYPEGYLHWLGTWRSDCQLDLLYKCYKDPPWTCAAKQIRYVGKCLIIHEVNAATHNALSVRIYLAKNISVIEHPQYSPCDIFLFSKVKIAFKGTQFESLKSVKAKATWLLKNIQDNLQRCFQKGKIRNEGWMNRGGDKIPTLWIFPLEG